MERLRTTPSLLPALRLAEYANASAIPLAVEANEFGEEGGGDLRSAVGGRRQPVGRLVRYAPPQGFSATRSGRGLGGG